MRRVLFAIAFMLAVLVSSPPSFAQVDAIDASDAGVPADIASAPAEITERESLPARLGKAVVFGLVVSVLLLGGRMWRRGRRKGRPKRQG